jgi:predicted NBD/HSP70 family sugar kinase
MFNDLNLATLMSERLDCTVVIDNDAVAFGLAESKWGSAASHSSILVVTLGTGIGTALISSGRPLRASDGQHPEGGHISVPDGGPCYCGLSSCWEPVASRTALDKLQTEYGLEAGQLPPEAWSRYAEAVAVGLDTHLTIHRPEAVVLAGSAARYFPAFGDALRKALRDRGASALKWLGATTLGDAGAEGACLLAERRVGWTAQRGQPWPGIFIQAGLSAIMDRSRTIEPGLYRRYLTLFLDGIRTDRSAFTQLPVPALSADQTHQAMTRKRRDNNSPN